VPYDEALMEASMRGQSILEIGQDSRAYSAVLKILEEKL
jgi:CO dehydrogenase nickel-insertion accessory protein CooC1